MPIVTAFRGLTVPSWTVTGQQTLSGQPFLYMYRNATQALTTAVGATVAFDTTVTTQGDLSPSAGVVTIGTAGIYLICAGALFASNATGTRTLSLVKGAVTLATSEVTADQTSTTELCVSQIISLAAADTVKATATQASGGNLNVGGVQQATFISIFRLG